MQLGGVPVRTPRCFGSRSDASDAPLAALALELQRADDRSAERLLQQLAAARQALQLRRRTKPEVRAQLHACMVSAVPMLSKSQAVCTAAEC